MGELCGTVPLRELTIRHQERDASKYRTARIPPFSEPADVLFDRRNDPGSADAIYRDRTNVVLLKHDNLQSRTEDHHAMSERVMLPITQGPVTQKAEIMGVRHITVAGT